jgi:hypothetical protein
MVIKTYLSKNNTLLYNSTLNTSRNPVSELVFGGEISDLKYNKSGRIVSKKKSQTMRNKV